MPSLDSGCLQRIDPAQLVSLAAQLSDIAAAQQAPSMTFGELFNVYYEKHALTRTKRPQNAWYFYSKHGRTWESMRVDAITTEALQQWVDDTGNRCGTYAANRAVNLISAIYNWGARRRLIRCANPCIGVERFRERSRERFAAPKELQRLADALHDEPAVWRDFVWLCLFTGARKGNLLAMRWQDLDFELAHWRIPETKNGESLLVALTDPAVALLKRRKSEADPNNPWVFPGGRKAGSHRADAKRMWTRVRRRAGIDDLRVHDLRRTLASYLAMQGASPYQIGKALGHLDPRSTAVYARLDLTGVRGELEKVHRQWLVNCLQELPVCSVKSIPATVSSAAKPAPANGGVKIEARLQVLIEGRIIVAMQHGATTKKELYRKIGGKVQINAGELDRILSEMEARRLVVRYRDESSIRHWQYYRYKLV